LTLGAKQKLTVSFKINASQKKLRPKQVFIRLFKDHSSFDHYVVAKGDQLLYNANLNVGSLSGVSGDYSLELIVADPNIENPIHIQIASLDLTLKGSSVGGPVSNQLLLPEIRHEFRVPEKRPNPVVSLIFTALVAAPLLLLFVGWLRVGININNFPFSGTAFLCAVGFHGCLFAILGLFVLYWLNLTMFQTLGYLALLAIPTIPLGQQTLRHVYIANLPKTKKD